MFATHAGQGTYILELMLNITAYFVSLYCLVHTVSVTI